MIHLCDVVGWTYPVGSTRVVSVMSSFFGGGQEGPSPLTVAKIEAETMTDMFNRMTVMCWKKCVVKQVSPDMTVGEMSCVDRCVGKYLQAKDNVEKVLGTVGSQMQIPGK